MKVGLKSKNSMNRKKRRVGQERREANTVMPCITKIGQFIDIHSQSLDPGTLLCQALGNHCSFGKRQLVVCKGREISLPDPSIFLHSLVQVQSSNSAELL